jgi:hypothetical protein
MATRLILRSNFRKLPGAAREGIGDAVDKWVEEGVDQSRSILTKLEARRGYFLNSLYESIEGDKDGELQAHFGPTKWYGHFFEFGTYGGAGIEPMPFVRPAKRKADTAFKREAGTSVERAIRRRAAM